ncbi:MAG: YARHG domain-containing protein [Treponema sp.]|jgi:hypothetical protein|nr:YARHG domain-containing protein [Treponema sp.]
MKNKWVMAVAISLALNYALAGCNRNQVTKSITIENINTNDLNGNHIGIYLFKDLQPYGHYTPQNTAISYREFDKKSSYVFDLVVPVGNIFTTDQDDDPDDPFDWWTGKGNYYIAIKVFDELDYPVLKDIYIFMDKNNSPAKVPISKANTTLDFSKFRKGNEFYRSEIAEVYENDLIYEYDPLYESDLYYDNDFLIDVVYEGNTSALDKAIDSKMLDCFDSAELRLLRNMIFAKYNYRFGKKDLRDFFSKFSWYKGAENDVRENMTATDWQNISMIQNLEKKYSEYVDSGNFGERFSLKGQIGWFEHPETDELYRTIVKKLKVDGKVTVKIHSMAANKEMEIAQAELTDGQFNLELGEIPPDLLKDWESSWYFYGDYSFQHSDPETKLARPRFYVSGTYIDLYGVEHPVNHSDPADPSYIDENGNGYNDEYYYLYSDRDNFFQGVTEGEPGYTNWLGSIYPDAKIKTVMSLFLKKGWNKIKYSITYNGKYIIQKSESSPESGFYEIIGIRR